MKETLYESIYVFSKEVPKFIGNLIASEYMRLRPYACEALNPCYKEWNTNFGDHEVSEDDELADYGGTEYCNYISTKARDVLKQVNKEHPSPIIKLDVDEISDIIAKFKIDRNVIMTLELRPIEVEVKD